MTSDRVRYVYDDTKEFGEFLVRNWSLPRPSSVIYYRENTDPNMHDFKQDEVSVYITESGFTTDAEGIAYDSLSPIDKMMRIYVTSINREDGVTVTNEIMRICMENRLYPFAEWDILIPIESRRVFPAYRYFQTMFTFILRDVVKPLPNVQKGC